MTDEEIKNLIEQNNAAEAFRSPECILHSIKIDNMHKDIKEVIGLQKQTNGRVRKLEIFRVVSIAVLITALMVGGFMLNAFMNGWMEAVVEYSTKGAI